jgi:PIN domain nuclease of toxin-antitoxin system
MACEPKRLSAKAREAIRNARQDSGVAVATITVWELAWLAAERAYPGPEQPESFVRKIVSRVILRPVTPEIVALAEGVPQGSCRSRDWLARDR